MAVTARLTHRMGGFQLDASLDVPATGVTAVFGPSGSGKTTLIRCLAGLERAEPGMVNVDGVVWQDATVFVPVHRRRVGYVPQASTLFEFTTVRGNLRYAARRSGAPDGFTAEIARLLGLSDLLDRPARALSGGESRRVAVARALAAKPRLLLMDEPLAGLDDAAKDAILPYLEAVRARLDAPLLYVSHSLDEVARLADHLLLMEAGRVTASGPLQELLTRLDLPLALAPDAESVLVGTVSGTDPAYHVTRVETGAGTFRVTSGSDAGTVRLRIRARDVSITRLRPAETSILNVFPARVEASAFDTRGQAVVRLRVGDDTLLARITRMSHDALTLAPGAHVFAQVKSVALLP